MQGTNLSVSLLSQVRRAVGLHITKCGNSSVGRARPCQGRGREFKSRFPLFNQTVARLSDFVYRLEFATLSPVGKRPKEIINCLISHINSFYKLDRDIGKSCRPEQRRCLVGFGLVVERPNYIGQGAVFQSLGNVFGDNGPDS